MERENLEHRCQRGFSIQEERRRSRETPKWKTHEGQRTEAVHRDGTTRSSDEVPETGRSEGVVLWCGSHAPTRRRSTMQMG